MSTRKSKRLELNASSGVKSKISPVRARRRKLRTSEEFAKTPHDMKIKSAKKAPREIRSVALKLPLINDIVEDKIVNIRPSRSSIEKGDNIKIVINDESMPSTDYESDILSISSSNSDENEPKEVSFKKTRKSNLKKFKTLDSDEERRATFDLEKSSIGVSLLPNASIIDLTESLCETMDENKENVARNVILNNTFEMENKKEKILPRKTPSKVKFDESTIKKKSPKVKNNSTYELSESIFDDKSMDGTYELDNTQASAKKSSLKSTRNSKLLNVTKEENKSMNVTKDGTFELNDTTKSPRSKSQNVINKDGTYELDENKDGTYELDSTNANTSKVVGKQNGTFELEVPTLTNTPRILARQVHFNTPPSGTSTPAVKAAAESSTKSNNKKLKGKSSFSEQIYKPKPVILKASSKKKVPNFALLHKRAFEKMENVEEYLKRKEDRAKLLMSGHKPADKSKNGSQEDLMDTKIVKAKKQLPFEAHDVSQNKSIKDSTAIINTSSFVHSAISKEIENLSSLKESAIASSPGKSLTRKVNKDSPLKFRSSPVKTKTPTKQNNTRKESPQKKIKSTEDLSEATNKTSPIKQLNKLTTILNKLYKSPEKPVSGKVKTTADSLSSLQNKGTPVKKLSTMQANKLKKNENVTTFSPAKPWLKRVQSANSVTSSPSKTSLPKPVNKHAPPSFLNRKKSVDKPAITLAKKSSPVKTLQRTNTRDKLNVNKPAPVIAKPVVKPKLPNKAEQIKAVATKSRATKPALTDKTRDALKGVRSNRRFDLLMKMRNMK